MKYIFLLALLFCCGCKLEYPLIFGPVPIPTSTGYLYDDDGKCIVFGKIVIFNKCEYLFINGETMTHLGNCHNKIHIYNKTKKGE